jgi:hypothetical protein
VNFITGVPKFAVADCCSICEMWFPKDKLLRCPCCNMMFRKRALQKKGKNRYITKEEIDRRIEEAKQKGWKVIDTDKLKKAMLDYKFDVEYFEQK